MSWFRPAVALAATHCTHSSSPQAPSPPLSQSSQASATDRTVCVSRIRVCSQQANRAAGVRRSRTSEGTVRFVVVQNTNTSNGSLVYLFTRYTDADHPHNVLSRSYRDPTHPALWIITKGQLIIVVVIRSTLPLGRGKQKTSLHKYMEQQMWRLWIQDPQSVNHVLKERAVHTIRVLVSLSMFRAQIFAECRPVTLNKKTAEHVWTRSIVVHDMMRDYVKMFGERWSDVRK
jgi:hypothetical protein